MNICILINIYSIYLLYKEVLNVKLQLDDISSKLNKDIPVTETLTQPCDEKEKIVQLEPEKTNCETKE